MILESLRHIPKDKNRWVHLSELGFFGAPDSTTKNLIKSLLPDIAEIDAGLAMSIYCHCAAVEILGVEKSKKCLKEGDCLAFCPGSFGGSVWLTDQAKFALVPFKNKNTYILIDLRNGVEKIPSPQRLAFRNVNLMDILFDERNGEIIEKKSNSHLGMMCGVLVGHMRRMLRLAEGYAGSRIQGGRKISQWSELKRILADLKMKMYVAEELLSGSQISSLFFLQSQIGAFASDCLQVFGGAGYIKDFEIERLFREAHYLSSILGNPIVNRLEWYDGLVKV
ncbi:MAG: hypothetical protein A4S09_13885 [Proteobacteria bacterium SG_bin7]|nr:MAG: hypothetical protein A4S09_13885 [Proteobacteria bacterium SG_bin7]